MTNQPTSLLAALENGAYDAAFQELYGPDVTAARNRAAAVVRDFAAVYGEQDGAALFSGPGRTEIGGNHTDHQHGHVLCASVDLDMLACAAPNDDGVIRVRSAGYPDLTVRLDDLSPKADEVNTSAALVRGVAAKVRELGFRLRGFDAACVSTVLSGSGLSSSAAYESLISNILNSFCCDGQLDPITQAKIGQYAENVYFGKPCGLMDQMGACVGNVVAIDFLDPAAPVVRRVDYDFAASGHALCIVDTGSCHADLTDDYADITREMGAVAAFFGKTVLREVPEADFRAAIPSLRAAAGDRAVLRAMHYYADDRRAVLEAEALDKGDFDGFLTLVRASGRSSALCLENTWSPAAPAQQAIPLALAVAQEVLGGRGAVRVHGGGFAGTIQAFVPEDLLPAFRGAMEGLLGQGMCHVLRIRPVGGCRIFDKR
jgi:galactokinase